MFDQICNIICLGENVSFESIKQDNRKAENVYCRQLIMYFARVKKVGTLDFIGKKFNLDHATVIHSVKAIQNYIETNKLKRERIEYYATKLDCIKEIYTAKMQLEKLIIPLKQEMSALEQRLINVNLTVQLLSNKISNLYK